MYTYNIYMYVYLDLYVHRLMWIMANPYKWSIDYRRVYILFREHNLLFCLVETADSHKPYFSAHALFDSSP